MVKSVSSVLGILFVVSSAYYLTFWSQFDIDVFQYMQVADLIKGAAYSLREAFSWLLILVIEVVVGLSVALLSEGSIGFELVRNDLGSVRKQVKVLYVIMISLFILSAICGTIHCIILSGNYLEYAIISSYITIPLTSCAFTIAYIINDMNVEVKRLQMEDTSSLTPDSNASKLLDYSIVFFCIYFLGSALSYGSINAQLVINRISYDYISNNDDIRKVCDCKDERIVYLGAISDKYFFQKYKNKDYFIVKSDSIEVLHVAHFKGNYENRDPYSNLLIYLYRNYRKPFIWTGGLLLVILLINLCIKKLLRYIDDFAAAEEDRKRGAD